MQDNLTRPVVPKELKVAAGLITLYGLIVLLNALWFGFESDFGDIKGLVRACVRFGGTLLLAWGLVEFKKWAWWGSMLFSFILLILGLPAIIIAPFISDVVIPLRQIVVIGFSNAILLSFFVLLIVKNSRQAFNHSVR